MNNSRHELRVQGAALIVAAAYRIAEAASLSPFSTSFNHGKGIDTRDRHVLTLSVGQSGVEVEISDDALENSTGGDLNGTYWRE